MSFFSTEFPIRPIKNSAAFVAQVLAWLRGSVHSTVLNYGSAADLSGDSGQLSSPEGEELRLREFVKDGNLVAVGFRHGIPDDQGRVWRTEAVVRRDLPTAPQDLIRLRTQCIAKVAAATIETPRKPYFLKAILQDGWGGVDGSLSVSDQPWFLVDDKETGIMASQLMLGGGVKALPVLYISSISENKWPISPSQIRKLAFDLGGIAHVVVEPNRAFSFSMREATDGRNAFGGAIGISIPKQGIVRRLRLGLGLPDADSLIEYAKEEVIAFRNQLPSSGWDWTELQEQALKRQRELERSRLSFNETEQLYQEELNNLQDRISQLEEQLKAVSAKGVDERSGRESSLYSLGGLIPEIYEGELEDRVRLATKECVARSDQMGLDDRSVAVFNAISSRLPRSAGLMELESELDRAVKDPSRLASEIGRILSRHGYQQRSENKHVKLQPDPKFIGLNSLTISKTPSDHRGLKNMRSQIDLAMGLTKLPK